MAAIARARPTANGDASGLRSATCRGPNILRRICFLITATEQPGSPSIVDARTHHRGPEKVRGAFFVPYPTLWQAGRQLNFIIFILPSYSLTYFQDSFPDREDLRSIR
jgi:hypothetical protein